MCSTALAEDNDETVTDWNFAVRRLVICAGTRFCRRNITVTMTANTVTITNGMNVKIALIGTGSWKSGVSAATGSIDGLERRSGERTGAGDTPMLIEDERYSLRAKL